MLKHILTLLILIPIFIFSQNRDGNRTFFQYMNDEGFLIGFTNQIQIVDIDNDSESEIVPVFC